MATSQTEYITKGTTDLTVDVNLIQDNSGTNPGDPSTGLAFGDLTCYYRRGGTGALTQLTLVTLADETAAHADGGFVEIDGTNAPGGYRLDLSDAIVATGETSAKVWIAGNTNTMPHVINIILTEVDWQDGDAGGLSRLDAAITTRNDVTPPTVSELNARTLPTASYATLARQLDTASVAAIDDMFDGTGGMTVTLGNIVFNTGDATDTITFGGSGSGDVYSFTRTGAGELFDTDFSAGLRLPLGMASASFDADIASVATLTDQAAMQSDIDDIKAGIILGTAVTGTLSTTQATTDLTGYTDDQLTGRVIIFTGGAAEGEASNITDYASASGLITFDTLMLAPSNTDPFKIV